MCLDRAFAITSTLGDELAIALAEFHSSQRPSRICWARLMGRAAGLFSQVTTLWCVEPVERVNP
jgi:hypothetical protein